MNVALFRYVLKFYLLMIGKRTNILKIAMVAVPIGMERGGIKDPAVFIDYRNLYKHTTETGELMFKRTLSNYSQLPNGWELYRRLLASQPDHSVSICSTGFVSCLAQLLVSEPDDISPLSGVELVRKKVKCLYLMAGIFTSSEEADYNFLQDPTYAKLLFEFWPRSVDVVFSPMEVGNEIEYRPETVVTLTPEVATIFTPSATGNARYQKPGSKVWCDEMLAKIRSYLRKS